MGSRLGVFAGAGGVCLALGLGLAAGSIGACGLDVPGTALAPDGSSTVTHPSGSDGADASGDAGVAPVDVDAAVDVAPPTVVPDAAPAPSACMMLCPPAHGVCVADLCTITCNAGDACGAVTCPPGIACKIACNGAGSCGAVICAPGSLGCQIDCAAGSQCGAITCDAAKCNIACNGLNACVGSIAENGYGTIKCAVTDACTAGDPTCKSTSCGCHCNGKVLTCSAAGCSCPGGC